MFPSCLLCPGLLLRRLSATMLEAADDLQRSGLFWSYMQHNIYNIQIMLHMATSGQVSTSRHFRTAGLHMSLILTVAF